MPEVVTSIEDYTRKLYGIVDDDAMRRISRAAGFAGKDAGIEAVTETLGADRAMSNFKGGRVKLGVGFDPGIKATEVVLKHGPPGLWMLADKGRNNSGRIYPRVNGRKGRGPQPGRAVMTPQGPRAASSYSRSRGLGTLRRAAAKERTAVPKAAFRALQVEIGRVVR